MGYVLAEMKALQTALAIALLGCEHPRPLGACVDASGDAGVHDAAVTHASTAASDGDYLAPDEPFTLDFKRDRVAAPACNWEVGIAYPDHETKTFLPVSGPLPLQSKTWRCAMSDVMKDDNVAGGEQVQVACRSGRRGGIIVTSGKFQRGMRVSNTVVVLMDATQPTHRYEIIVRCKER